MPFDVLSPVVLLAVALPALAVDFSASVALDVALHSLAAYMYIEQLLAVVTFVI